MRITKVFIPKSPDNREGLQDIKMDKLGSIVLLAGKNGAGKTRIANKIFSVFNSIPDREYANKEKKRELMMISQYEQSLTHWQNQSQGALTKQQIESNKQSIDNISKAIVLSNKKIQACDRKLEYIVLETSEKATAYKEVRFVPTNLNLLDPGLLTKEKIKLYVKETSTVGVAGMPSGCFAKIQSVQDRWFNATHQDSRISDVEKAAAVEDYIKLKDMLAIFLNTTLNRNVDGEATLFGFPLGKCGLSFGQTALIQYCLAIYSQETALRDLVLFLDEPENHLHPSVIIETLDRIQKCNTNGQIWIATHSIPLLAHFDPSMIWYVENGKISHAGKMPEKVLQGLLGGEDEISKLDSFIGLPAQYAMSQFAFECLFAPTTVMTGPRDSQTLHIREELIRRFPNGAIRLLDYGAGQGRLISNLCDLEEGKLKELIARLDYIAFDKNDKDKDVCESSISKVYDSSEKRYFNDMALLKAKIDKGSFDVILMCNVLHELDPKDWLSIFNTESGIVSLLKEDGILLVVENHQMPKGEKAYQKGFLVLDELQFKELFKITESDKGFITVGDAESKIKAHTIPSCCLRRIDADSRIKALRTLSSMAKDRISELREKEKSYKNGLKHAFWTQQFANAELALAELSGG